MRGCEQILTEHNSTNYGERMRLIMSMIPENGSVKDLPSQLRPKSYFGNTYARLNKDLPSPTITRNFGTPSSSIGKILNGSSPFSPKTFFIASKAIL